MGGDGCVVWLFWGMIVGMNGGSMMMKGFSNQGLLDFGCCQVIG